MKSFFSYYLRYILFLIGIQMLFKILFIIIFQDLAHDARIWEQLLSLYYGFKLDLSLAAYILVFPTFMLIFFCIFKFDFLKIIIGIYTFLILLCIIPVHFTNLVLYKYWKYPIDRSIFDYLSTPGDMMASLPILKTLMVFGLIILFIYTLYFKVYLRWVSSPLDPPLKRSWVSAALFLILLPSLTIPIRGGLTILPLQVGSVYYHQNIFLNHAATNPVWNLIYTLIERDRMSPSASFFPEQKADEIKEKLYDVAVERRKEVLNTPSPNIILIMLESFGQLVVSELEGDGKAAPNFNALVSEGIFFKRIFSSGVMTDRAMGAVLSGYPSLPGTCIIHFENKVQKLPQLNLVLKSAGYNSTFLYGGDINFAHIRSYLVSGGFEKLISVSDFPRSIKRSNWGVPDQYLFEKLMEVTDQATSPFFHVMMTLSSHAPFDIPMEPVFPGSGTEEKYYNSVYYTDQFLGEFIRIAKTKDWWDQTLIIFIADHGFRVIDIPAHDPRRFNIPMLWVGGAVAEKGSKITKIGSQTDFPLTLLNQLGLNSDEFRFSKDLFSMDSVGFAFYAFNEGIGFVTDSSRSAFSLVNEKYLLYEGFRNPDSQDQGLAYLQSLYRDFKSK